jgi:hypothetical protein
VPFLQLPVLGLLADNRVLHNRIAEVVHDRCNGEDATQAFVQTSLRRGLFGLRGRVLCSYQHSHRGDAGPAATLRFMIEGGTACAMVRLRDGEG